MSWRDSELFDSGEVTFGTFTDIVMPGNYLWVLEGATVRINATATVGNRQPVIEVIDDLANVVNRFVTLTVVTAGLTGFVPFMHAAPFSAPLVNGVGRGEMSVAAALPGWLLRVRDGNAVDPLDAIRFTVTASQVKL